VLVILTKRMTKLNKTKFMDAVEGSSGIVSNIARACDVSPTAINKFIERSNGDVKAALTNEKNRIIAVAQNKLQAIIENGEEDSSVTLNAVKFFLERKGGFVEKSELKQENTGITAINVIMAKDKEEEEEIKTVLPIETNNEPITYK